MATVKNTEYRMNFVPSMCIYVLKRRTRVLWLLDVWVHVYSSHSFDAVERHYAEITASRL